MIVSFLEKLLIKSSRFTLAALDCINAEIENFLSLCGNATVYYGIGTSKHTSPEKSGVDGVCKSSANIS